MIRAGCRRAARSSAEASGRSPSSRSASSVEARADVADDRGVREVDLLHVGRGVADVDDRRAARAHEERRLLDRVVPDRQDEVGLVDGLVHVVALGEGCGAHPQVDRLSERPPGDHALAHLRGEERDAACGRGTRRAWRPGAGRLAAAPSITSGRCACRIIVGGPVAARSRWRRGARSGAAAPRHCRSHARRRCPRAAPGAPGPAVPRPPSGRRRARSSGCSRC